LVSTRILAVAEDVLGFLPYSENRRRKFGFSPHILTEAGDCLGFLLYSDNRGFCPHILWGSNEISYPELKPVHIAAR
jgi:hypothetical protein